jgi:hypothetical protein
MIAVPARLIILQLLAKEHLSYPTRQFFFAGSPRPFKQVGVDQSFFLNRTLKPFEQFRLLPHQKLCHTIHPFLRHQNL